MRLPLGTVNRSGASRSNAANCLAVSFDRRNPTIGAVRSSANDDRPEHNSGNKFASKSSPHCGNSSSGSHCDRHFTRAINCCVSSSKSLFKSSRAAASRAKHFARVDLRRKLALAFGNDQITDQAALPRHHSFAQRIELGFELVAQLLRRQPIALDGRGQSHHASAPSESSTSTHTNSSLSVAALESARRTPRPPIIRARRLFGSRRRASRSR